MMIRMNYKYLQKVVRGFSNHRRIEILDYLESHPNVSLSHIAYELGVSYPTIGEHSRRLELAGLITKEYQGKNVVHKITPLGSDIMTLLRRLE